MRVCIDRNRHLTQYGDRWVYENETEIASLRETLAASKSSDIFNGGLGTDHKAMARIEEILAASETWCAEIKAAEDSAGITEAFAGVLREEAVLDGLRFRIASLPANTADGLRVKARAAFISLGTDYGWVQREYLPRRLAGWSDADGHSGRFDILAISLVVDAMMLGTVAKTAPSDERAAA